MSGRPPPIDYSKHFNEGEAAAKAQKPVTDNPYPAMTPKADAWDDGWWDTCAVDPDLEASGELD